MTGSFDSAYTMTVTSESESIPGGKMTMTMAAKWLGPCTADQKPGDMIMGNGMKMNILEMQKRLPSTGIPLPVWAKSPASRKYRERAPTWDFRSTLPKSGVADFDNL